MAPELDCTLKSFTVIIMQSNCALASAFIGGKGTYIAIDTVLA
jgi:hypothetical protein